MPAPVVVVEYDPDWPRRYEALRLLLAEALGPAVAAIEHVGSTAVPGLAANPIIDIDVAVADYSSAHELRPALEAAGFRRVTSGDLGDSQWYLLKEAGGRRCHLSVTYPDSDSWRAHIALRDLLRNDASARSEYGRLKVRLAAENLEPPVFAEAKADAIRRLIGEGWRRPPERRPLVSRPVLALAGLVLFLLVAGAVGLSYYSETSRGPDGLPDHRPIRAADLEAQPEAKLFYPGSAVVRSTHADQGSDPSNVSTGPAKIDTLLTVAAAPDTLEAWYELKLPVRGWSLTPASVGPVPGEIDFEWRRGRREFFELALYPDRTYRAVYLVGTGG